MTPIRLAPRSFPARACTCFALIVGLLASIGSTARAQSIISTVFGGGLPPPGTPALSVPLGAAQGVAVDAAGNLYVAATGHSIVYKIDTSGLTTIVAGTAVPGFSGDGGPATAARLDEPREVEVDAAGNIFIADTGNNRVRRVDAATGIVTTYAGGGDTYPGEGIPSLSARLSRPEGLALDGSGNVFISENLTGGRVRRVDSLTGIITTYAGGGALDPGDGGLATNAFLKQPEAIALDAGGHLFIADRDHHTIRRVDAATRIITRAAGGGPCCDPGDGGPATSAFLDRPKGVAVDGAGNIFISDTGNFRLRKVDAVTGLIETAVPGNVPDGLAAETGGNVLIAYPLLNRIRRRATDGTLTYVAGNSTFALFGDGAPVANAMLANVSGVTVDPNGNTFIVDTEDQRVRRVDAATGVITTYAGGGGSTANGIPATSAALYFYQGFPVGLVTDSAGNLFIANQGYRRVQRVDAATGLITTYAGGGFSNPGDGGPATNAVLNIPIGGLALDAAGNLFIADSDNQRVRRVDAATGIITTFAGCPVCPLPGDGGPATSAHLEYPSGVAVDGAGNVYIADIGAHQVRRVDGATGIISTLSGTGSAYAPITVASDAPGNVYIAYLDYARIRRRDAATGVIRTVAGGGQLCPADPLAPIGDGGPATSAVLSLGSSLDASLTVAPLPDGDFLIADTYHRRIRKVDVPTCTGADADGDGQIVCVSDCDDSNPAIFDGNPELCDRLDNDCDGSLPAGESDHDCDGAMVCAGDCDDYDLAIHPGAAELCDGIDNDCSNVVDDLDADADGSFGCGADCDDADPLRFPGNPETQDGVDNNCNGIVDEVDDDGDGLGRDYGDCNDHNALAKTPPVAVEMLDADVVSDLLTLTWVDQAPAAGSGTVYDVHAGPITTLRPAGDFGLGACEIEDLVGSTWTFLGFYPPPGEALYFMFRAQNACPGGAGTYGSPNRDTSAAASTSPCQ